MLINVLMVYTQNVHDECEMCILFWKENRYRMNDFTYNHVHVRMTILMILCREYRTGSNRKQNLAAMHRVTRCSHCSAFGV